MKKDKKLTSGVFLASVIIITLFALGIIIFKLLEPESENNEDNSNSENNAAEAFSLIVDAVPDMIEDDTSHNGWTLKMISDDVRFIWSKDSSKSLLYDAAIAFDIQTFIDSELHTNKLPSNYSIHNNELVVGLNYGKNVFSYEDEVTPLTSMEKIIENYSDKISFDSDSNQYSIDLGDGNLFIWAQDIYNSENDVIFVLNPEPFIKAGVNIDEIEGWDYSSLSDYISSKYSESKKFIKAFNIK